jgi:hypothetical protein
LRDFAEKLRVIAIALIKGSVALAAFCLRLNSSVSLPIPRFVLNSSAASMAKQVLHLRSEQKLYEHRSALTPTTTKALIGSGKFEVHVEKSPADPDRKRIYDDAEFEQVGALLVDDQSWPNAPTDYIIVGLKELEEEEFPLEHTHVQFAHCYKVSSLAYPLISLSAYS